MNVQNLFLIFLVVSLTIFVPLILPQQDVTLLPEIHQSVSFNVLAPVLVISSDITNQFVFVNVSYFENEKLQNIGLINHVLAEQIEIKVKQPGLYIIDLITEGSGIVKINQKGLFVQNQLIIGILVIINISIFFFQKRISESQV